MKLVTRLLDLVSAYNSPQLLFLKKSFEWSPSEVASDTSLPVIFIVNGQSFFTRCGIGPEQVCKEGIIGRLHTSFKLVDDIDARKSL